MVLGSVVITGVSTGIGRAAAELLLAQGYRVFGSVRQPELGQKLRAEWGEGFVPLVFDVTDETAIQAAAAQVKQTLAGQPLFGLVNNAGIAVDGPLQLMSVQDFRQQLEVNLVGPLLVTQAFLPLLGGVAGFSGRPGRIVNISSVAGKLTLPFLVPYAVSKHGMEALSDGLRRELLVYGIDVITIGPGAVATPIWDKAEQGDHAKLKGTVYEAAAQKLQTTMIAGGRRGLPPAALGQAIFKALTKRRPRARYAVVQKFISQWLLPRLLPKRVLDRMLGQSLGLSR